MNALELVNALRLRLRQKPATALDQDTYTAMLLALVNQAKDRVEEAWRWEALRTTLSVGTVAGNFSYTLAGSNDRTQVLRVWDATNTGEIPRATYAELSRLLRTDATPGAVRRWGLNGQDSATRAWVIEFWPVPDGTQTLLVDIYQPQAALADEADVLVVPSHLVLLGALSLAREERGEEPMAIQAATDAAERALGRAIASEANSRFDDEITWVVG